MTDELLIALYNVCVRLLPIVGVFVLIFLLVLLGKLMTFMNKLNMGMDSINRTLIEVDRDVQQFRDPLNTVVKISHTVDEVHDASKEAAKNAIAAGKQYADVIKTQVSNHFKKEDAEGKEVVKEEQENGKES